MNENNKRSMKLLNSEIYIALLVSIISICFFSCNGEKDPSTDYKSYGWIILRDGCNYFIDKTTVTQSSTKYGAWIRIVCKKRHWADDMKDKLTYPNERLKNLIEEQLDSIKSDDLDSMFETDFDLVRFIFDCERRTYEITDFIVYYKSGEKMNLDDLLLDGGTVESGTYVEDIFNYLCQQKFK